MKKLVAMFVVAAAMVAVADTVYLKSGSVIKGESGLIQDGKLKFASDDLGDLNIKIENIVKIDTVKDHVVQYNDDSTETVKLDIKDGKLVPVGSEVNMDNVKKTDPEIEKWHGAINIAFNAARGNTYENSGSVFGSMSRRWEKDRFGFDGGYYYSETGTRGGDDKKKSTDRWELHAQHDHFWMPKFYGMEMGRVERDMIKGVRARYELGLGPGYQWLDKTELWGTGKWTFNQQLAIKWTKEELENSQDVSKYGYAALSYEHHLAWLIGWNDDLELFHNFRYDPEIDDFDKFLMRANIGFSKELFNGFTFVGKIECDYDSKPASDRRKWDMRYIAGLGYKW